MKTALIALIPKYFYLSLRHYQYKKHHKNAFIKAQKMRQTSVDGVYSYVPFDKKKAIFVHVPKCAGVSVSNVLFGGLAGGHTTLEEYIGIFEPRCIQDYFKFTFVRNPWDRLVSAFFFLKNGGFGARDKEWAEKELGVYETFEDFVLHWVNRDNIMKWHHFRPQVHYIRERGKKVDLDFIGYIENGESDFNYIRSKLHVEDELPKRNAGSHRDYKSYYNDETKRIVASVYSEDIDFLGYTFDNSNLAELIAKRNELIK